MKQVSVVLGHRSFTDMVNQVQQTYLEYSLTNGANGDEIMVIPDQPAPGFVTLSVVNQLDEDDA